MQAPPADRRPRGVLAEAAVLALLAIAVRLGAFLAHRGSPFAVAPILDAELYDTWAREIAAGRWLGDQVFFANPLYPYFLGLVYTLADGASEIARLVQHGLGVLTVLLVHRLTGVTLGRGAARVAGVLAALYLPFIVFEDTLLIATLGVFLIAAALVTATSAATRDRPALWLATGALSGLTLLARPTLLPVAILLWVLLGRRATLVAALRRRALPIIAGVALVILPVTVRNVVVSGQWVLVTAHGGETFYAGNHADADGSNRQPDFVRSGPRFEHEDYRREASRRLGREVDLPAASRYWAAEAFRFIASQPADYLRLELRKLGLLFHAYEKGDNLDLETRRDVIGFYALPWPGFGLVAALGLVGIGIWFAGRRAARGATRRGGPGLDPTRLLVLTAGVHVVTLLAYFVTARYRLPIVIPLLPFAGFAVSQLVVWTRAATGGHGGWRAPMSGLLALVVLLAILHRPLPAEYRNDPAVAAVNLGYLLERAGDLEAATASYRRATTLNPAFDLAHFNLGVLERRQGRFAAAAAAFERALAIHPTHGDALEQLRLALQQQGERERPLALYRRAIAADPHVARYHVSLGRLHVLRGEPRAALAAWEEALALDPGDERTRRRLARLRQALAE